MHEGQGGGPRGLQMRAWRPDLVETRWMNDGSKVAHPYLEPFHVLWSRTTDQTNVMELLAPVAMATGTRREMSQLLRDKIFPFPKATECLSSSFVYSFACHWPTSPYFLSRSFEVYVSALWLNKNSARNEWCNCLHGQMCVYSLTGPFVLSPRADVFCWMHVSAEEFTEEFSHMREVMPSMEIMQLCTFVQLPINQLNIIHVRDPAGGDILNVISAYVAWSP